MTPEERLRLIAESLPDGASVTFTREGLRGLISESTGNGRHPSTHEVDLPAKDVASLFDRSPSTVRGWIKEGMLKAYKFGREWRVTHAALQEFQERQRAGGPQADLANDRSPLGRWRSGARPL